MEITISLGLIALITTILAVLAVIGNGKANREKNHWMMRHSRVQDDLLFERQKRDEECDRLQSKYDRLHYAVEQAGFDIQQEPERFKLKPNRKK